MPQRTVLVCGASGFIGQEVVRTLTARGHRVLHGVRDPAAWQRDHPDAKAVAVDFSIPRSPAQWVSLLRGVEVVVNAVGLFRETPSQRFADVHARNPCALFEACSRIGVRRVVQISALGADEDADTAFHLSKRMADDCLLALPLEGVVLLPSLVFAPGGASTAMLISLACAPLVPLPAGGEQLIQPVHRQDLVDAVVELVEMAEPPPRRVPVVGPSAITLRAYLDALRSGLGLARALWLPLPRAVMNGVARLAGHSQRALLDEDSWRMLQRGNTASPATLTALLGRPPVGAARFTASLSDGDRAALRFQAVMAWSAPLWRASLTVLWFISGIVSLGLYPVEASLAMLHRVGVPPSLAPWALYGAALLDMALGVLTLLWPRRRLWLAQMALIVGYTLLITFGLPEQWLHPFAPIVKNLPVLAMLITLYTLEARP